MPPDHFLTAAELAERYRKSVRTIYDWRLKKVGPKVTKVGNRLLYRLSDVEAFEQSHEGTTAA